MVSLPTSSPKAPCTIATLVQELVKAKETQISGPVNNAYENCKKEFENAKLIHQIIDHKVLSFFPICPPCCADLQAKIYKLKDAEYEKLKAVNPVAEKAKQLFEHMFPNQSVELIKDSRYDDDPFWFADRVVAVYITKPDQSSRYKVPIEEFIQNTEESAKKSHYDRFTKFSTRSRDFQTAIDTAIDNSAVRNPKDVVLKDNDAVVWSHIGEADQTKEFSSPEEFSAYINKNYPDSKRSTNQSNEPGLLSRLGSFLFESLLNKLANFLFSKKPPLLEIEL